MRKSSEPGISGVVVRTHIDILRETRGGEPVAVAIASLPEGDRQTVEGALAVDWIPIRAFEAFYAASARHVGRPVADLHWEIGRLAVERNFKTLWRVLLRFTNDDALVARTPLFHQRSFDTGKLSSRMVAPGRAELELAEWPAAPDFVRRGLCIGITTVLTMAGREAVKVAEEKRRDGAAFSVTWTP